MEQIVKLPYQMDILNTVDVFGVGIVLSGLTRSLCVTLALRDNRFQALCPVLSSGVGLIVSYRRRFRAKYHPEECDKRRAEHRAALKRRGDIFRRLLELNYVENVTCDLDKYDGLVRLLDAGVTCGFLCVGPC